MDQRVEEAANKVIGAAIEVHKQLGPGYLESVYEEALAVELTIRGVPFARQMLAQELGEMSGENCHAASPWNSRSFASAISCIRTGVACRYQYVFATSA